LTTRYLADPNQPDALFARVAAGGTTAWYLRDNINSVRQVVGPTGAVLNAVTYDSFGNVLSETNPSAGDRFKYTGREYDAELGVYYYRARYYDPATGRFLGEDPLGIGAGDPNFYRYVGNTPTTLTDPSGMVWYPGKYLYQYYREWRRGRELDARLDEVQRRRYDPLAAVMQSGGGTWSVRNTYGVADPAFDRNWRQGMGDAAVLANVGVIWTAAGPTWVSPAGQQFVWTNRGWWNSTANRAATAEEAAAATRAAAASRPGTPIAALNPPIRITPQGLQHVVERHTLPGLPQFANKSKFNAGEDVAALIRSGTQQPMTRQPNGRYARTFDVGRIIGYDRNAGRQTSIMTIITEADGRLVTAFPGAP
jgi:RHS repeat-associated protein